MKFERKKEVSNILIQLDKLNLKQFNLQLSKFFPAVKLLISNSITPFQL